MNMKLTQKMLGQCTKTLCWAAALGLLSACSLMDVEREHCPQGLNVGFVYEYNTQQANMFSDHVGGITLFVFDNQGNLVTSRTMSNNEHFQPIAESRFRFQITDIPAGDYQLLAFATQKDYQECLDTPGAKFRMQAPQTGEPMNLLQFTLDHDAPDAHDMANVLHEQLPLDTLWTAMNVVTVSLDNLNPAFATVPLMRHTKHIHLSLLQTENPEGLSHEDYEVHITAANSTLQFDNSLVPTPTLRYTPFQSWTTSLNNPDENPTPETPSTTPSRTSVLDHTAHYEFFTSRILYAPETPCTLTVTRRETGEVVFSYDLAKLLANGRDAYEIYRWSPQEYLDREYDYDLQLVLSGNRWDYVSLNIQTLSWSKRIQNVEL